MDADNKFLFFKVFSLSARVEHVGFYLRLLLTILLKPLKEKHPSPGWKELKGLVLAGFLVIWISFWFTSKEPAPHFYMVFYPLVMLYSCYIFALFAGQPKWKLAAKIFLILGLYFQVGYVLVWPRRDVIYLQRADMAKAIQQKNYHLLGERRPKSLY